MKQIYYILGIVIMVLLWLDFSFASLDAIPIETRTRYIEDNGHIWYIPYYLLVVFLIISILLMILFRLCHRRINIYTTILILLGIGSIWYSLYVLIIDREFYWLTPRTIDRETGIVTYFHYTGYHLFYKWWIYDNGKILLFHLISLWLLIHNIIVTRKKKKK